MLPALTLSIFFLLFCFAVLLFRCMQNIPPACVVHTAYLLCCEVRGLILGRNKAGRLAPEFHPFYLSANLADGELAKALTSNTPPPAITRSDLPYSVSLATIIVSSPLFMENSPDTRRIWVKAADWLLEIE